MYNSTVCGIFYITFKGFTFADFFISITVLSLGVLRFRLLNSYLRALIQKVLLGMSVITIDEAGSIMYSPYVDIMV